MCSQPMKRWMEEKGFTWKMPHAATTVEGKVNVIMKFTSEKEMTLLDALYVPKIRKYLLSGPMLSKKGFKLVFKSDKFVLTKGEMYVGKGYLNDGLFKINCTPKIIINENINASSYIVKLSSL